MFIDTKRDNEYMEHLLVKNSVAIKRTKSTCNNIEESLKYY